MVTVEHGHTRCPRCMKMSEYRFLDRGNDTLEYEVRCSDGHVHSEVTAVSATTTAAA